MISRLRFTIATIFSGFSLIKSDLLLALAASMGAGAFFVVLPYTIDSLVEAYLLGQANYLPSALLLATSIVSYTLYTFSQQTALQRLSLQLKATQAARLVRHLLCLPLSVYRHSEFIVTEDLPEYSLQITEAIPLSFVRILMRLMSLIPIVLILNIWNLLSIGASVMLVYCSLMAALRILLFPLHKTSYNRLTQSSLMLIQNTAKIQNLAVSKAILSYWKRLHFNWLTVYGISSALLWIQQIFQILFPIFLVLFSLPLSFGMAFGLWWSAKAMVEISNQVIDLLYNWRAMRDFLNLLETPPELQVTHPIQLSGSIQIKGLSFRYTPNSPLVLNKLSMTIRAGECVAIVGTSDSGKSSLLSLLIGEENPSEGTITYDAYELQELSANTIYSQIGTVMQGDQLETGSLWMNISGFAAIPIEKAWEAAARANIDQLIAELASKMHTLVDSNGSIFSRGQVQRLLLARALVNKPSILLLDEAINAVDDETQKVIFDSLKGMTRIIITKRLSLARCADSIYVLDRGSIVESGDFDSLMKQNGLFSELMKRQQV